MNEPSSPTPTDVLEMLDRIGPNTPPEVFRQVYDVVSAGTADRDVLARLLHVAGMYLDRHPGVVLLPRALVEELLGSNNYDHLLAGLKAVRHSTASTGEIVARFLAVMKRHEWEERYAGLYQLDQMVCGNGPSVAAATEEAVLDDLRSVLALFASRAPDGHARDLALRCNAAIMEGQRA